jgi:hypothetical protein
LSSACHVHAAYELLYDFSSSALCERCFAKGFKFSFSFEYFFAKHLPHVTLEKYSQHCFSVLWFVFVYITCSYSVCFSKIYLRSISSESEWLLLVWIRKLIFWTLLKFTLSFTCRIRVSIYFLYLNTSRIIMKKFSYYKLRFDAVMSLWCVYDGKNGTLLCSSKFITREL